VKVTQPGGITLWRKILFSLGEELKFLFAVFKYFTPFLFLQALLAEIGKHFSRG